MSGRPGHLLPLSLGIADGIVNALILASGAVLHGTDLDVPLALRVGTVALVTALFTVFVAVYAQLRAELEEATHQLNISTSGRLAATSLGRQAIRDAAVAALIACTASFAGAVAPLLCGAALRTHSWVALVVSVLVLGALGAGLGGAVSGNRVRWIVALVLMGTVVAVIGTVLRIA
jgi:VIT1/CCC1 family predicted Fe2+/Mn2+ transporter